MMTIIDPNSIERIEKQIYVNNMKKEWGISQNFVAERVRNKEAEVMMGQVEEDAFRFGSRLTKQDIEGI